MSFEIKCNSYLLLPQASDIWAPTDREDFRIWSTNEYFSSPGKFRIKINISDATTLESLYTSSSLKLYTYIMIITNLIPIPDYFLIKLNTGY